MSYALGLAGGLGVNTLSTDVGYRGAATAAAIAAILISTNWIALIGVGVANIGIGITVLREGHLLAGIANNGGAVAVTT